LAGSLTVAGGAVISSTTGAILAEKNAAYATLGVMLFSSLAAQFAALYVLRADHCEGRSQPG
jgi:hypothetical protein